MLGDLDDTTAGGRAFGWTVTRPGAASKFLGDRWRWRSFLLHAHPHRHPPRHQSFDDKSAKPEARDRSEEREKISDHGQRKVPHVARRASWEIA